MNNLNEPKGPETLLDKAFRLYMYKNPYLKSLTRAEIFPYRAASNFGLLTGTIIVGYTLWQNQPPVVFAMYFLILGLVGFAIGLHVYLSIGAFKEESFIYMDVYGEDRHRDRINKYIGEYLRKIVDKYGKSYLAPFGFAVHLAPPFATGFIISTIIYFL